MHSFETEKQAHMKEILQLMTHYLPLSTWGFKESARFFHNNIYPTAIYDSQMCRMRVYLDTQSKNKDHNLVIYYGKLNISNNAELLLWNGQTNYHLLWHGAKLPLFFLDGLSPQEAIQEKQPRLIRQFEQSAATNKIEYPPQQKLMLNRAIWDTYGQRFFELFDNRNTSLWEQYSTFIKVYLETRF